jgi:polyhydroxybutyrate depolymerase
MKNKLILLAASLLILSCRKNEEDTKKTTENIQTLSHDNITREYLTFVPTGYDSITAVPLMLNFHGFGGTISTYSSYASMQAIAERENFILAYPQGTSIDGYAHWNPALPSTTNKSNADDFGFIEALIQRLSNDYSIDSEKIYACGYSNGGMMSFGLANHKSNLIAAVASVSGAMLETDNTPNHPMPVLMIHGTSDGVIPYAGNNEYISVESTLAFWRNFNSTDSVPISNIITSEGNTIQYDLYSNGNNGVSVEHYKINQGGHEWFDLNYERKNTGELIWEFFSKYDINGLRE